MKRRCEYVLCTAPPVRTVAYWGEHHDLCEEHAELIGDDGSDQPLELVD